MDVPFLPGKPLSERQRTRTTLATGKLLKKLLRRGRAGVWESLTYDPCLTFFVFFEALESREHGPKKAQPSVLVYGVLSPSALLLSLTVSPHSVV